MPLARSYPELDSQLMDYVEFLWDDGSMRTQANLCLAGVQHFLNVRRQFTGAWSLVSVWQRAELPVRAAPLPVE
eukprot:6489958-Amphidinium_carterae.1